jgi:hypothetical protein
MEALPLFKSHYSIGRSILTLEDEEKEENQPDSIIDIAKDNKLKEIYLVEDNMTSFLQAYTNTKKYNIIASIQVVSQFGSVQTYFNTSNFAYKIGDDVIPFVNVIILNQDFNPVNFNNIDWFLNLSFKFIYRKELQLPTSLQDYQQDFTARQELLAEEQRNYLNSLQNN